MPASDKNYVRNQITTALINLMKKENFEDISITQLVKEAKVGRASFYRHFTDSKDVIRKYLTSLTHDWRSCYDETPEDQRMPLLLNHFYTNKDFYLTLYSAGLSEMLHECMEEAWNLSSQSNNKIAYLIAWYAGAAFGWINEWIKRGMLETPTEMIEYLNNLLTNQT